MDKLVVGTSGKLIRSREAKTSCSSELQGLGTTVSRGWAGREQLWQFSYRATWLTLALISTTVGKENRQTQSREKNAGRYTTCSDIWNDRNIFYSINKHKVLITVLWGDYLKFVGIMLFFWGIWSTFVLIFLMLLWNSKKKKTQKTQK